MRVIDSVKNEEIVKKRVCFSHWKKLTDTADFQVRMLNSQTMNDWLCVYWNNCFCILKLKTDTATWQWFWAADHLSQSVNNLEVYNFTHHELSFQIHIISIHNWLKIIDEDWEQNEFVVIANIFKWMYQFKSNTSHLINIIIKKFNMYHWHLCEVKDQ